MHTTMLQTTSPNQNSTNQSILKFVNPPTSSKLKDTYLHHSQLTQKEDNTVRFIRQNINGFKLNDTKLNSIDDISTFTELGTDVILLQESKLNATFPRIQTIISKKLIFLQKPKVHLTSCNHFWKNPPSNQGVY